MGNNPATDLLARLKQEGAEYQTDIPKITACAVAAFGGAPGLAHELRLEYDNAMPGSAVRTKILSTILDMIRMAPVEEEFDPEDEAAMAAQLAKEGL